MYMFAKLINDALESGLISAPDLAGKLEVSTATILRWAKGTSRPVPGFALYVEFWLFKYEEEANIKATIDLDNGVT